MRIKRVCSVLSLLVAVFAGYACVGAFVFSTPDVQAVFTRVFRPEIDFAGAIFVLNSATGLFLAVGLTFLAVAQLVPQEMTPPSRLLRAKNRVDQVCVVGTEESPQSLRDGVHQS
jgi:hypothetical protein